MSNESLFPQISLSQYQTQIEPMFDVHFEFLIETFAIMIWNVLSSTRSLPCTSSFNLTIQYCFVGDVELIILNN